MQHRLRSGLPKVYADHRRGKGVEYRREFLRIEKRYGEPIPLSFSEDVSVVADLWSEYKLLVTEAEQVGRARREGKGKRPSSIVVENLMRRKLSTLTAYQSARRELESRLEASKPKLTIPEVIAKMDAERKAQAARETPS